MYRLPIYPFSFTKDVGAIDIAAAVIVSDVSAPLLYVDAKNQIMIDGKIQDSAPLKFPAKGNLKEISNWNYTNEISDYNTHRISHGMSITSLYITDGTSTKVYLLKDGYIINTGTISSDDNVVRFDLEIKDLVELTNVDVYEKNLNMFSIKFNGTVDRDSGDFVFEDATLPEGLSLVAFDLQFSFFAFNQ